MKTSGIKKWFRGLRIKLLMIAAVPLIALVLVGYQGYSGAHVLGRDLEKVAFSELPGSIALGEMDAALHTATLWLVTAATEHQNPQVQAGYIKRVHAELSRFKKADEDYKPLLSTPKETELYNTVHDSWVKLEETYIHIEETLKAGATDSVSLGMIRTELRPHLETMEKALHKLEEFKWTEVKAAQEHSLKDEKKIYNLIILFGTLGFGLSLILSTVIASRLSSHIGSITHTLAESADHVSSSSNQIAASSTQLSEAAIEQAASLEETASSLEEISAMITKASENAQTTSDSSEISRIKTEEGRQAVDEMMESINEISDSNNEIMQQMQKSNQELAHIVSVIQEIGNKTKVINDIVFQTKLLSFNASVEAARAGEHGKGFAVVAEEVGNLAQMSGNAALEISSMLESSTAKVSEIVEQTKSKVETLVKTGKDKVDRGVNLAQRCSDVLAEILQNVSQVSNLAKEISQATQEQSQGVAEINKAVGQLDTVTQQNAAANTEASAASSQLASQATSLKEMVDQLKVIVDGGTLEQSPQYSAPKPVRSAKVIHLKTNESKHQAPKKMNLDVPDRDNLAFEEI